MINTVSFKEELEKSSLQNTKYFTHPFYFDGIPLISESEKHARWGMTLLTAGSMRFRWNESNENRRNTLKTILNELKKPVCSGNCSSSKGECDCKLRTVPLELIHSKKVFLAEHETDTKDLQGDGIITKNPLLVPTVTVADCVPVFLYDHKIKAAGAFHSGWKGTGIAEEGVKKMQEAFDSKPENISAAIGPHIGSCCYYVDKERADYFTENFGENCIKKAENPADSKDKELIERFPYRLSLTEANIFVLKQAGIREENIVIAEDCTCCTKFSNGQNIFGSFRRQAAFLPAEISSDERSRSMCVQAAFCYF
ncbi:polyphenol oxidase family protein [Treponema sp.]|uniref:polyphenol oxidase family protein n=1 Tax=Treponema sp. TaxID=166 RepID=UPI00388D602A